MSIQTIQQLNPILEQMNQLKTSLHELHSILVLFSDTDIENYQPEMMDSFLCFLLELIVRAIEHSETIYTNVKELV